MCNENRSRKIDLNLVTQIIELSTAAHPEKDDNSPQIQKLFDLEELKPTEEQRKLKEFLFSLDDEQITMLLSLYYTIRNNFTADFDEIGFKQLFNESYEDVMESFTDKFDKARQLNEKAIIHQLFSRALPYINEMQ